MKNVYRIFKGRISLGDTASKLPDFCVNSFFKNSVTSTEYYETVTAIAKAAARCCPEINVLVGPRLWSVCDQKDFDAYGCRSQRVFRSDGRVEFSHSGIAFTEHDAIMIASDSPIPFALATLHHEIFHMLEKYFDDSDFAAIDDAVSSGLDYTSTYLSSGIERRARLYEFKACSWDEGSRPPMIFGVPLFRVDRILWHLYTGKLAIEIKKACRVRPLRFPGVLAFRSSVGFLRQAWSELGWQGSLGLGLAALFFCR